MRALSVTQPWATLIALGEKRVETRGWQPISTHAAARMVPQRAESGRSGYREVIGIHAAKAFPDEAMAFFAVPTFAQVLARHGITHDNITQANMPRGAIVATAILAQTMRTSDARGQIFDQEFIFGDYSDGRQAWFLADVVALRTPVSCLGALGLWTIPRDVELAVVGQEGA